MRQQSSLLGNDIVCRGCCTAELKSNIARALRLRIGCCWADPFALQQIAADGFDYAEMTVSDWLVPEQPDEVFNQVRQVVASAPLPVEAFHGFLPAGLPVTGPHVDWDRLSRYVAVALDRVAELGGKVVVFGSGPARKIPRGFDRVTALQQLIRFLRWMGDAALTHQLVIAVEHLNPDEDNLITSFNDAIEIVRRVDHPAVGVLVDLYHLQITGEQLPEPPPIIPLHVHIADIGRHPPAPGPVLHHLITWLQRSGYTGRVSIEALWKDRHRQAPSAIAAIREAWRKG